MLSTVVLICSALYLPFEEPAGEPKYQAVEGWLKAPADLETIGNSHGDVALSSNGDVYVSVLGGPRAGVQVYDKNGKYLRNVPGAPNDFHGFVIRAHEGTEYIYGSRLSGGVILKMKLDGTVVLTIDGAVIPEEVVRKQNDKRILRLTSVDVAPDGKIYAVDGYSSDYIHVFASDGGYLSSFGGKSDPYGFRTNHKIAIDTRFDPPQILCCDRENRRIVHLSIDGKVLGVTPDMKRPAAVAVYGDWAAVAEIEGRVSLLDKEGRTVAQIGANDVTAETATNKVAPAQWRNGILTAPHGIAFDSDGNMFVTEYNQFGRVIRYNQ